MKQLVHEYSKNITNQRIIILGPTPPPLGGVSVHVQRVAHKLQAQGNVVYTMVPTQELRYRLLPLYMIKLMVTLCWHRPTLVYYHTSYLLNSLKEMQLLGWAQKVLSYKLVLVEHDCRQLGVKSTKFVNAFRQLLKQVDNVVLIGTSTHKHYRTHGMLEDVTYSVESAFLPPELATEQKIFATYPKALTHFLEVHHPLLVANAFQLSLLQQNNEYKDLYGFDVCIDLIKELKGAYPNIGMVFALATIGNKDYFIRLKSIIDAYGLQDNIYFLMDQKELWPLLKRATLLMRPTLSDGASVSVEEAVYVKTPVVASNVCWRPEGVVTYAVGDQQDMIKKVSTVLHERIR